MSAKYAVAKGYEITFNSVSIGAVNQLGGFHVSRDTEDVTTVTSADGWREWMATYRDGGDLAIGGYVPVTNLAGLKTIRDSILNSDDPVTIEVNFPAALGGSWSSSVIVTEFTMGEAAVGGVIGWSATLKRTGAPTVTDPATSTEQG